MILFRFQSVIALPALSLYLAWTIWRRHRPGALTQAAQFVLPVCAGIVLHLAVNYLKFETIWGKYTNEGFHTPLLRGLRGFLLSPGDSIFIFTPLLLLTPWALSYLMPRFRAEGIVILGLAATYLIFYAKYTAWHGLWSAMGPRYLVPIVPLLLLPLGPWLEHATSRARVAVIPLAMAGFWVQLVGVAVSFSFLYNNQGWTDLKPPGEFLFSVRTAPVLAGSTALIEGRLVDMWLVHVYRDFGVAVTAAFLLPILILLVIFARKCQTEALPRRSDKKYLK